MSIEQLERARERVRSFLLPSLSSLTTGLNDNWVSGIRKEKSANVAALARSSLRLTEEMTPEINRIVELVCRRIQIDRSLVDVYVFPGADLSGFCYIHELPITVGLSSSLIKTLVGDELAFVLGHEIGHALFKETANFVGNELCLEDQIYSRAVEISVDRVGLLAANNCDAAFRAILKTLSGLDDSLLRFDFSHFMAEAREALDSNVTEQQLYSSHPPLAQRFKALVSFSSSDVYQTCINPDTKGNLSIDQVNNVIATSLTNAVDAKAYEIINKSLTDLTLWIAGLLIISQKKISLSELQSQCGVELNKIDIEKAISFVDTYPAMQKAEVLNEKIQAHLIEATRMAPRATMKLIDNIERIFPDLKFTNLESIALLITRV